MDLTHATRSGLLDHLAAHGITGAAAEAIAAETAAGRHARRVVCAKHAALAGAAELLAPEDGDAVVTRPLLAAVLCLLDALGIGGRMGVEGRSAARVPCFTGLGKGRKQAMDGPAWDAAIGDARISLVRDAMGGADVVVTLTVEAVPDGLSVEARWGDQGATVVYLPMANRELAPWLLTMAREALRRELGLPGWHDVGVGWGASSAEAAASAVNGLVALLSAHVTLE